MLARKTAVRRPPPQSPAASRRRGRPAISAADRAGRLDEILAAATRVFSARGYRRTQMADIAREMGASPGTLYNYVEGKEALFHLLVERGFQTAGTRAALDRPVVTPPPGATLELLRRRLEAEFRLPKLEAAVKRTRVADPRAELEGVIREIYAAVARGREGIVLLERSAVEWPELAALFYRNMRREFLAKLERYLAARMRAGLLRRVPDPAAAARLLNETVAWMAMHRHGDIDSRNVTDEAAESTTVDLLLHALAKE